MRLAKSSKGWVLLRPFVGCLFMGPYDTKREAEADKSSVNKMAKKGHVELHKEQVNEVTTPRAGRAEASSHQPQAGCHDRAGEGSPQGSQGAHQEQVLFL